MSKKHQIETADKRTVATDALATLGTIITEAEKRDAIHLAVEPVIAGHKMDPGEDCGFLEDGTVGVCDDPVGIVDPFLTRGPMRGERFWLIVYPRQITSLRHVWEHPKFSKETVTPELKPLSASEQWLRDYADQLNVTYKSLLENTRQYLKYGEYWNEGEKFEGQYLPDDFWEHYQAATGEVVRESDQQSFFSCSC